MSGNQLYNRGVQLIRRMVAPLRLTPELEFVFLKPWVWAVISRKARMVMDARTVATPSDLVEALQDFLMMDGERIEGQASVFRKQSPVEGSREKVAPLTCFTCGKQGHKAAECWSENNSGSNQPVNVPGGAAVTVICFTCGEPGHKSPQCPTNSGKVEANSFRQIVKTEPKEVPVKPVRRIRRKPNKEARLSMLVNSQVVSVLLDSGSAVTVVPANIVAEAQKTGDTVAIKGFGAKEYVELPMAEIPFEVGQLKWVEPVALAPMGEEFVDEGVVFGLDLLSARGLSLVKLANEGNPAIVGALDKWEKGEMEAGAMTETLVKKEEEGGEKNLETDEEEEIDEEEEERPKRVRRLVLLTEEEKTKEDGNEVGGAVGGVTEVGGASGPDASMVKGEVSQLGACTQVSSNVCFNFVPSSKDCSQDGRRMHQLQQKEKPDPQSRATGFVFVGGDVRRREREKEVLPVGQDVKDRPQDVKDRPQDVTRKKENSLEGQR